MMKSGEKGQRGAQLPASNQKPAPTVALRGVTTKKVGGDVIPKNFLKIYYEMYTYLSEYILRHVYE